MKKVLIAVLAVCLCLFVCACGSSDENASAENKGTEAPMVENKSETVGQAADTDQIIADGMRSEVKDALDTYEAFFVEYCDIMKKYQEDPTNMELMTEYTAFMGQYAETMTKMEALNDGTLNDAEMKYYIEVSGRISQMLLEIANET